MQLPSGSEHPIPAIRGSCATKAALTVERARVWKWESLLMGLSWSLNSLSLHFLIPKMLIRPVLLPHKLWRRLNLIATRESALHSSDD